MESLTKNTVAYLPLDHITPDPRQPRKHFDPLALQSLATDIHNRGVQQPITVRPDPDNDGHYLIVYGERRYRASQLAKRDTIPALLYDGDTSNGLEMLLDQVKENHLRQDLNPMEWAGTFYTMHKSHGLKYSEIEALLKKSGITNMGRSYISNIIRLTELPEWAQTLIRNGQLTGAHGKYLLPAMSSDKVLDSIYRKLQVVSNEITTRDLQRQVYIEFHRHHPALNNAEFDYQSICVKSGCQQQRKVSDENNSTTFCLDRPCYITHNSAALMVDESEPVPTAKKAAPAGDDDDGCAPQTAPRTTPQRDLLDDYETLSSERFPLLDCQTCGCRIEAEAEHESRCVNVPCYREKLARAGVDRQLAQAWLRGQVETRIASNEALSRRLIDWAAAASPCGVSPHDSSIVMMDEPDRVHRLTLDALLIRHNLTTLADFMAMQADDDYTRELILLIVADLSAAQLAVMARALDIAVDDYSIDEAWINGHEDDAIKLFESLDMLVGDEVALKRAVATNRFTAYALQHTDRISIPYGMRWAITHLLEAKP